MSFYIYDPKRALFSPNNFNTKDLKKLNRGQRGSLGISNSQAGMNKEHVQVVWSQPQLKFQLTDGNEGQTREGVNF